MSNRTCRDCGGSFSLDGRGRPPVRCGACAAVRSANRPIRPRRDVSTCAGCGGSRADMMARISAMPSYNHGAPIRFCVACYNEHAREKYRAKQEKLGRVVLARGKRPADFVPKNRGKAYATERTAQCWNCGKDFERQKNATKARTCASCPSLTGQTKHAAEMRRRNAIKAGDKTITWQALGDRDGWACHLCGKRVPRIPGIHNAPMGATVDHLVPIANGGAHSWDNVALAHRTCNISRGNRGSVQLLLVG